ncbi:hypothetical protein D1156_15775 [Neglecta sp. X58]|nr:hypothetical protein [Neglectibacter sp. X58]NCE82415.1 hypothetical protein [Neglectibacter sp. X58]
MRVSAVQRISQQQVISASAVSCKREWAFFLDERGRKKYNELCRKCERSCKQSFRATVIQCPHYLSKRRTRQ